jgi:hypothetical protein
MIFIELVILILFVYLLRKEIAKHFSYFTRIQKTTNFNL